MPQTQKAQVEYKSFIGIPVSRWVFRGGAESRAAGSLGFVDPMLRRRLSPLAKMTLSAAYECSKDVPGVRFVYASRHGELARTTVMLENLAEKEPLSPTSFSLSVLNASAGLFSMIFRNTAPTTAISACKSSFGYGLLEAFLQFSENPGQPVLYVFSDEPLPAIYGEEGVKENASHAIGLLLRDPPVARIRCSISRSTRAAVPELQSLAFLKCLERGRSDWSDGEKMWLWERVSETNVSA
ncbi:MAG: beta-ketoacyl synthase chain length factor [Candidatus Accumulibacter sp.]|nr:beta-ketoacyl synthase chain length factor [Accumulibacter sp.]